MSIRRTNIHSNTQPSRFALVTVSYFLQLDNVNSVTKLRDLGHMKLDFRRSTFFILIDRYRYHMI